MNTPYLPLLYPQVQEANAQLAEQDEVAPVQRRIEPRSADDSLSGVVRCLCFADTYLRDGKTYPPTPLHASGLDSNMNEALRMI